MTPEFLDSVAELYNAFEHYPAPKQMSGSPVYGHLDEWNRDLARHPLREIPAASLGRFAFKALTTWGEVEGFKHFLPRMLELLPFERIEFEAWVLLDKLNVGKWGEWPTGERQAITRYLEAFWELLLTDPKTFSPSEFTDLFAAIAQVHPDFEQLLHQWRSHPFPTALKQLVAYIRSEKPALLEQKTLPGFYDSPVRGRTFHHWISSAETLSWLESGFWAHSEKPFAKEISEAVQFIEWSKQE